jgi:hypothetical protein
MTIDEMRAARERLEDNILDQLTKFKQETGLSIVDCDITTVICSSIEAKTPQIVVSRVRLKTEPI